MRFVFLFAALLSATFIAVPAAEVDPDEKFEDDGEAPFDIPGAGGSDEEPEIQDTPESEAFEPQDWTAPDPQGHYYFAECFKEKSGLNSK